MGKPKGGCLPTILFLIIVGIICSTVDFAYNNWQLLETVLYVILISIVIYIVADTHPFSITSCHFEPEELNTIQKEAAYKEMTQISSSVIIGFGGFVLSALFYIMALSVTKEFVLCSACIGFMVLFLIMFASYTSRMCQLYSVLDNVKRILICPYCKSPNIQAKFVKGSYTRGHSHTEVSQNINPFKPFTYKNIDSKPVTTTMNYKNTYSCKTCGKVFDKPQVFEQTN